MLRLTTDQADLLDQLQVRRQATALGAVLATAWPMVTQRLTDRWLAFVEAAMLKAHSLGVDDVVDLGRYASLWCLWGASFEDKPGFEWAREVLTDGRRRPSLKVHQLVHRTRDELRGRPPSANPAIVVPTLAQWDKAMELVVAGTDRMRDTSAVYIQEHLPPPVQACDLSVLDMKLAEINDHHEYRSASGALARLPSAALVAELIHLESPSTQPLSMTVLSRTSRAGTSARLNLRVQPLAVCNPSVHPAVTHVGPGGQLIWRGRDTMQLSLTLHAAGVHPEPLQAVATPQDGYAHTIAIESCGMRDAGAPFESQTATVRVFPATQWLLDLRHPAWPVMNWPAAAASEAIKPAVIQVERDGQTVMATDWDRSWAQLPLAFQAGMDKLFNAWVRSVVGSPTMELTAQPLVGQSALTWGYRKTGADEAVLRCEGRIDLTALSLEMQLSAEIAIGATRARIRLRIKDSADFRMPVVQLGATAADGQGLGEATRNWLFPFSLEIDPLADPSLAVLSAGTTAADLLGGVAGSCGLRPSTEGPGWQWFFSLSLLPCSAVLLVMDPIQGQFTTTVSLLPALPLLEWSAG